MAARADGLTLVRPESLRGQQSALAAHLNVGSTGIRVADSKSSAADQQQLATLRAGGRLNAVGGHVPDWTEKWSNPRAIQLMNSFRPQTTAGALVRTDAAAHKALSESGRSEAKTGGVVYRDALRWYKPPPGQPEYLPKKLRLAPTARPKSVPAVTQRELDTGVFTDHFPPPPPIEQRRFPDLNYPFTPVEKPPTAKYTAVHSAMQHGVNNAIPNPLAALKNASRDAYFKSSSIAHNAAIAKADGTIALVADEEKRSGRAAAAAGSGALAPVVTRLSSPKGAAPAAASPSARVGSADAKQSQPQPQLSASASSGELSATATSVGAVPTRVNYKRRSFVARQFFHQDGVFESAGGVTHAYRYFMAGSRPFGGAPRMWQPSKTTETGYRYDCYTKY